MMLREHKTKISMYNALLLELNKIDKESIEGLAIPAVVISDMPKSITNNIHDPTFNAFLAYSNEADEIRRELIDIGHDIDIVENALKSLRTKQLWLIKARYFDHLNWQEIRVEYCKQFPQYTEKRDGTIEANKRPYIPIKSIMNPFYQAKKRLNKIINVR